MTSLTTPLQEHHKHCDELFADAEEAVAAGNWTRAALMMANFAGDLETHFSTEETLLFPAFETHTGMAMGPTQMMRMEHAQMRELLAQMKDALAASDGDGFAGAAETLLVLMQQHNMKEENILYPMCDRSLAAQAVTLGAQLADHLRAA